MRPLDYIIIGILCLWFVLSIIHVVNNKKKGKCTGCSGCCSSCPKNINKCDKKEN